MKDLFKSTYLLKFLEVVAWVIFVGLCIEAGALLVNFVISLYEPELLNRLYQKLDLQDIYLQSKGAYYCSYIAILALAFMKAYLFYVVVMLMSKLDLNNPFSTFVADKITTMSHLVLSIGITSYVTQQSIERLLETNYNESMMNGIFVDPNSFIMVAAILYVISVIFKRGIELQNENDLTV